MVQKQHILLLSLATGAGHVRAAQAIQKTIEQEYQDIQVTHTEITSYLPTIIQKTTVDAYDWVIKNIPTLWKLLYYGSDAQKGLVSYKKLTEPLIARMANNLASHIKTVQPTTIISTHFFCTDLCTAIPQSTPIPIHTVLTDYSAHRLWINNNNTTYFAATEQVKTELMERNVRAKDIVVSGIPVDPVFYTLKKSINTQPIILVLSGGQGLMASDSIVNTLVQSDQNYHIIAIAGKNNDLYTRLINIKNEHPHATIDVIGWTNVIHEYIEKADIIISKPGGLTTTEAIVSNTPMIAVNPIPGQEEANANYIQTQNYGKTADHWDEIPNLITEILKNKKHAINTSHVRPAANTIIHHVLS